jgi:hypothetical protein
MALTLDLDRIEPVAPGASPEHDVNDILQSTVEGWWEDSRMMGVIAHIPEALRGWMHAILGAATVVDPVTMELMALRGAFKTGCRY